VTYALIRADIVNYETVCSKRPYVVVAILLFAAFLTPPDIISQLLLGAPTYLLFEAGLLAARRFHGRSPAHRAKPITKTDVTKIIQQKNNFPTK
jgi:sec-independent protein translocase protein TatC